MRHRFADRRDPALRPADAVPVEFVLMAYPILDLPPRPETDEDHEADSETAPDGLRPPRMSDPLGIMAKPSKHESGPDLP
jgi:hypothetical protein